MTLIKVRECLYKHAIILLKWEKMYNYSNLCDYEFEILCKDIMQKKLGKPLQIFARGRDGGIDITDDTVKKNVVIQAKHYIKSKYADLLSSLKKEVARWLSL